MPKPKNGTLSDRQLRFIQEYHVDLNATQAAIRAGYSKKGARVRGSELLANRNIAAEIAKAGRAIGDKLGIKAADVLAELKNLGFSNIIDYLVIDQDGQPMVNLSDLTRDQTAAIGEVTVRKFKGEDGKGSIEQVKFKLADKRAALVDIGRHFGMFVDRVQTDIRVARVKVTFQDEKAQDD